MWANFFLKDCFRNGKMNYQATFYKKKFGGFFYHFDVIFNDVISVLK